MSTPSSKTSPESRVPSIRSFMRLSARRKVDLPHPDGPISAITDRSGMNSEMSHNACFAPYQNDIPLTWNLARTPFCGAGSRPLRLRSEMIAEYDNVDIQ